MSRFLSKKPGFDRRKRRICGLTKNIRILMHDRQAIPRPYSGFHTCDPATWG